MCIGHPCVVHAASRVRVVVGCSMHGMCCPSREVSYRHTCRHTACLHALLHQWLFVTETIWLATARRYVQHLHIEDDMPTGVCSAMIESQAASLQSVWIAARDRCLGDQDAASLVSSSGLRLLH